MDYYFFQGVSEIDNSRCQVITPYKGHRKKLNLASETISLNKVVLTLDSPVVLESKKNKKLANLIDLYLQKRKNPLTIKAVYLLCDTLKVIGSSEIQPAAFGIFYEDLERSGMGGTGHTMAVCRNNDIPFIDQRVWFEWLK